MAVVVEGLVLPNVRLRPPEYRCSYLIGNTHNRLVYSADRVKGQWWVERFIHVGSPRVVKSSTGVFQAIHPTPDQLYRYAKAEEFGEVEIVT